MSHTEEGRVEMQIQGDPISSRKPDLILEEMV